MANHLNDNVHTKAFTPREYQVELLDAAKERNIIVCLGTGSGKSFIAMKLIQEMANELRKPFNKGGKRTLYIVDTVSLVTQQASYIRHLTDLSVGEYASSSTIDLWTEDEWKEELQNNQVLVMISHICLQILYDGYIHMSDINLIVFDECHRAVRQHPMCQIMKEYKNCSRPPRVLGLTASLLNSSCDPGRLEGEIRRLEITLHSTAETASDIVSVLRYCSKPEEVLIQCRLPSPGSLEQRIEGHVYKAIDFLEDHCFDPIEIYGQDFKEELKNIPDPKSDPQKIFGDFLDTLRTLGPWCADRAALVLLIHIDKLKVKTPYERHFLLLCMVYSVMLTIRAVCEEVFEEYEEKDRILNFSTPKVLRLLEILRQFKPETPRRPDHLATCQASNNHICVHSIHICNCEINSIIHGNGVVNSVDNDDDSSNSLSETNEINTINKEVSNEVVNGDDSSNSLFETNEINTIHKEVSNEVVNGDDSSNSLSETNEINTTNKEVSNEVVNADDSSSSLYETNEINTINKEVSNEVVNGDDSSSSLPETNEINIIKKEVSNDLLNGDDSSSSLSETNEINTIKKEVSNDLLNGDDSSNSLSETNEINAINNKVCNEVVNGDDSSSSLSETNEINTIKKEVSNEVVNGDDISSLLSELNAINNEVSNEVVNGDDSSSSLSETNEINTIKKEVSNEVVNGDDSSNSLSETNEINAINNEVSNEVVNGDDSSNSLSETNEINTINNEVSNVVVNGDDSSNSLSETNEINTINKEVSNEVVNFDDSSNSLSETNEINTIRKEVSNEVVNGDDSSNSLSETNEVNTINKEVSDEVVNCNDSSDCKKEESCESLIESEIGNNESVESDISPVPCKMADEAEEENITELNLDDCDSNTNETLHVVLNGDVNTSCIEDNDGSLSPLQNEPKVLCNCENVINDTTVVNGSSHEIEDSKNEGQNSSAQCNCNGEDVCKSDSSENSNCDTEANCVENNGATSQSSVQVHKLQLHRNRGFVGSPRQNFYNRGRIEPFNRVGRPGNGPRDEQTEGETLCGIIFVEKGFTAKILYHLLNDLRRCDPDFSYLMSQYTVGKTLNPQTDPREAEIEHRKQEEVLKRFRMHECNLLVATSVLEEGIDVPKCNLVVRFDVPKGYRSYVQSKGRARAQEAHYALMMEEDKSEEFIEELAKYHSIEQMLLRKCHNREPPIEEELEADVYNDVIEPYKPLKNSSTPSVTLSSAVALVNRYCAKLPSDTFTRLTPNWRIGERVIDGTCFYECILQLPINSPVKQNIVGKLMPSKVLARRAAALQACIVLHQAKELDDNLLPIGKESFHDEEDPLLVLEEEECRDSEPRPGTTKRRQYYYKRIADALTDCRPQPGAPTYLYHINMVLTCPLPEEQNTRGRKIYPPEDSPQGFGILTSKEIPKICPFPIFTRSGEVNVRLDLSGSSVVLTEEQLEKIVTFLNYTFTSVLRLQKYLMMFDPQTSENSYFIVPTKRDANNQIEVDWEFLDLIFENKDLHPHPVPETKRLDFAFEASRYHDAVVMPWYRNQDQPQYFYVAEICIHLNPKSSFPGSEYKTFEEYYFKKYGIQIQSSKQPLLDVDHTSARLNFLTPRYVNRKGVALPTSSEETKRAKRENLEQKQILVPELCTVHPFPASLWRKAVCLPCILYRVNALLLANEIRQEVAFDIGLGQKTLSAEFKWRPLDFGWSLADVLRKSRENNAKNEEAEKNSKNGKQVAIRKQKRADADDDEDFDDDDDSFKQKEGDKDSEKERKKTANEILNEEERKLRGGRGESWMEIGTWSNEMAEESSPMQFELDDFDPNVALPENLTMVDTAYDPELMGFGSSDWGTGIQEKRDRIRYGSPSSWVGSKRGFYGLEQDLEGMETDSGSEVDEYERSDSESDHRSGLRIEFKSDFVAEAVEENDTRDSGCHSDGLSQSPEELPWDWDEDADEITMSHIKKFEESTVQNKQSILNSKMLLKVDQKFELRKNSSVEVDKSTLKVDEERKSLILNCLENSSINSNRDSDSNVQDELSCSTSESDSVELASDMDLEEDIIKKFSFDAQPHLEGHPGPSPSVILQALTMSNANDGINLERLETIGDSFLKYAITTYLYCTYDNIHEGKLSHLRSKQVSNLNLYRLGRRKVFGECMIATKFEPHDNWLPPCYYVPRELEQALIEAGVPASHWNRADLPALKDLNREEICQLVKERGERLRGEVLSPTQSLEDLPCFIPYNLITQHSIPDKSIADCVEALIGAYLISCGPRGALLFMAWLGIRVLPREEVAIKETVDSELKNRSVGSLRPLRRIDDPETWSQVHYGSLKAPASPLLRNIVNPEAELERLLDGYDAFERKIGYRFRDRSYLLQSLTHASYFPNRLTDCYQRLEFLGDAVLDYLITRHLYEDSRQHSPGALTDLRSALVNNTIFASLAVRFGFHKYFRHLSPGLNEVVDRFVRIQEENGHSISEEYYLIEEEECEEAEDVEVPKALGDVFESVAGAIFLDSGMSLDAVWRVYYRMMKNEIEQFSTNVPKSPIRELLELEPETAKFGKPEKLADGRRVRVTVEVFGKGTFKGIGRNYRIAKCTAAKCALKQLKKKGLLAKKS